MTSDPYIEAAKRRVKEDADRPLRFLTEEECEEICPDDYTTLFAYKYLDNNDE
jgi:hypothetical protein